MRRRRRQQVLPLIATRAIVRVQHDHHQVVSEWLDGAADDLATTPLTVAEVDHLVGVRGGRGAALGLSGASIVALAERLDTVEIATLDERHFRAVRPLSTGKAFRLLPADAQTQPRAN